jgi:adenylate kinase
MALNVIMLGAPGAGKGTQAERLARTRGIPKISTGDILREAVQTGTPVGLRAKAIMERGGLVGDDVMIGIVRDRLERPDAREGFVLDGFPRTVPQAHALDEIMSGRSPLIIVDIQVPEEELIRRLASRLVCESCGSNADAANPPRPGASGEPVRCGRCGGLLRQRSDDGQAVVSERLRVYHRDTKPLVDYYRARPTFRKVDGAQEPDRVTAELMGVVDATGGATASGQAGVGAAR